MASRKPPAKRAKVEATDAASEESDWVNVTVEFKFCSCETAILSEGYMVGTLHVPMLQHRKTGRFRIAPGTTNANGVANFKRRQTTETFVATFERPSAESPIETFSLGYHLQLYTDDNVHARIINSADEFETGDDESVAFHPKYYEFQTYSNKVTERELCRKRLNEWEQNCGGMLVVFANAQVDTEHVTTEYSNDAKDFVQRSTWKADYKIKLYTVLSAHTPNERSLKIEEGSEPNWGALIVLMKARFPESDDEWAKRAVENYKYFLEIKKENEDWNSEKFGPSKAIDEVWHAHLSFSSRYQYDMMAFCGHIIEHSPVLGDEARTRYADAFDIHFDRMKDKIDAETYQEGYIKKDFYDREFWPTPQKVEEQYREIHDGDSDDCCEFPFSQCG